MFFKRKSQIIGLIIVLLFPLSAAALSIKETVHPEVIALKHHYYLRISPDNRFWFLYADSKDQLWLEDFLHKKRYLVNESPKGVLSSPNIALNDKKIFVIWREKGPEGKILYFRAFNFKTNSWEAPKILDKDSAPLNRNAIQVQGEKVFVVWYGEAENRYAIYVTYSLNNGKTFSPTKKLTPDDYKSRYFSLFAAEGKVYVFGEEISPEKRQMALYQWAAKAWNREMVSPCGVVVLLIKPFLLTEKLGVVWFQFGQETHQPQTVWALKENSIWQTGIFKELEGIELSGLQVAFDGERVLLALSGLKRLPSGEKVTKNDLWVYFSENGESWVGPLRVRTYPFKNTHAKKPKVALAGKKALIAWEDYRFIRSNICFNYSLDAGKTWQKEDTCLSRPGFHNSRVPWLENNLFFYDGKFYFLGHRFESDALAKPHLLFLEIEL